MCQGHLCTSPCRPLHVQTNGCGHIYYLWSINGEFLLCRPVSAPRGSQPSVISPIYVRSILHPTSHRYSIDGYFDGKHPQLRARRPLAMSRSQFTGRRENNSIGNSRLLRRARYRRPLNLQRVVPVIAHRPFVMVRSAYTKAPG